MNSTKNSTKKATNKIKIKNNNNNNKIPYNKQKFTKPKTFQFTVFDNAPISVYTKTYGTNVYTTHNEYIVLSPQDSTVTKIIESPIIIATQILLLQDTTNIVTIQANTDVATRYIMLKYTQMVKTTKLRAQNKITLNIQQKKPSYTVLAIKYATKNMPYEEDDQSVFSLDETEILKTESSMQDNEDDRSYDSNFEDTQEQIDTNTKPGLKKVKPDKMLYDKPYFVQPSGQKYYIYLPSYKYIYPTMYTDSVYEAPQALDNTYLVDVSLTQQYSSKYPQEKLQIVNKV
jgi:hypothetical protein